jgi:hypothetical protein
VAVAWEAAHPQIGAAGEGVAHASVFADGFAVGG